MPGGTQRRQTPTPCTEEGLLGSICLEHCDQDTQDFGVSEVAGCFSP